ncbi:MAG: hypothetical protein ACRCW9_03220 [Cetobacterium sp.]
MSLIDFNFYNGDLVLKDFDCYTNSSSDPIENLENQLKTMLYSLLVYDKEIKNKFLGLRVVDKLKVEENIYNEIMYKIKSNYPLVDYVQELELIVLIISKEVLCYFYYIDPDNGEKRLLLNYDIKL